MPSSGGKSPLMLMTLAVILIAGPAQTFAQDKVPDFSYSRPQGEPQMLKALPRERPTVPQVRFGNFRPFNEIDNFILARIKAEKVKPAKLCDDWDFARRASLDLVGLIPTATDLERYFKWNEKERRSKWVDFLLRQPQYADHWTIFWGDLLRERDRVRGAPNGALKRFIHRSLIENRPYDQWVQELITAQGPADENDAAAYILRDRGDPDVLTVSVTQSLLGIQLKCAQCHDHPTDWWTQKQFQGMAGFWHGSRPRPYRTQEVRVGDRVVPMPIFRLEDRERRADGTFITGAVSELGRGRRALADLITRRDDPFFARVAVNRLWNKLMGAGLVMPVDNFSALNPPSHSELLDWLALEFVDHNYDLRHILRSIATSRTYQQMSARKVPKLVRKVSDNGDESAREPGAMFEIMPLRRMSAEQIQDSILAATGRYRSQNWLRASILKPYPPPPRDFLTVFGASDRETLLPRPTTGSVQQSLTLMNGDFVSAAIRIHPDHPLVYWDRQSSLTSAQLVDALFVQFLTRLPTVKERQWALNYVGFGQNEWAWEDLQWALINTREFQYIR